MEENKAPRVRLEQQGSADAGQGAAAKKNAAPKSQAGAAKVKVDPTAASAASEPEGERSVIAWLSRHFPGHVRTVIGAFCGLLFAIVVLLIGFDKAFFIALCVTVGVLVGKYFDGDETVRDAVDSLYKKNR